MIDPNREDLADPSCFLVDMLVREPGVEQVREALGVVRSGDANCEGCSLLAAGLNV